MKWKDDRIEELESLVTDLQYKNERLESSLHSCIKEKDNCKNENKKLRSNLISKRNKIETLTSDINSKKEELDKKDKYNGICICIIFVIMLFLSYIMYGIYTI